MPWTKQTEQNIDIWPGFGCYSLVGRLLYANDVSLWNSIVFKLPHYALDDII